MLDSINELRENDAPRGGQWERVKYAHFVQLFASESNMYRLIIQMDVV